MPTLNIPAPLRSYTGGTSNIDLHATDVGGAVQELTTKYPALYPHLFTDHGKLRPYVNLFVNDEDVRHLQGLETELGDQDRLRIIPSIAGGKNIQRI
jgi:molybdopterin converting factor small subunit